MTWWLLSAVWRARYQQATRCSPGRIGGGGGAASTQHHPQQQDRQPWRSRHRGPIPGSALRLTEGSTKSGRDRVVDLNPLYCAFRPMTNGLSISRPRCGWCTPAALWSPSLSSSA